jgi:hypothetical protein
MGAARPEDLEGAHRGTPFHRQLAQVARLKEARDMVVCRRTNHHAPRLGHLLEPCRQVGRVPDRRVVHTQVITNLPHHHEPRVQAHAHLQAQPALGLECLGHVTESALNTQGRVHGQAWTVFMRDGSAEQGHDPVAGVLVDRALEPVHLRRDPLEAMVHDLVHLFRVELLGHGREASDVGKEDGDLAQLPFQCAAGGKDLLGQVPWRVGLERLGARRDEWWDG